MTGIVSGGWAFVWGAYALSLLVLGGYAIRTFAVYRDAGRPAPHDRP